MLTFTKSLPQVFVWLSENGTLELATNKKQEKRQVH